MDGFKKSLGDTDTVNEIVELWHEYEDAKTPEALFVKDLDKFEMIVQALEYEKCKVSPSKKSLTSVKKKY
jgi:putative hydrolase of HD superfamily